MRLSAASGLGARAAAALSAAAQPAAKRQKRSDVLDSLGLGEAPASSSRSGLGLGAAARRPLGGTAAGSSNATGKAAEKEALRQWLAEEASQEKTPEAPDTKAETNEEAPAASAVEPEKEGQTPQVPADAGAEAPKAEELRLPLEAGKLTPGWQAAFAEAQDRWQVDSTTLRGTFYLSSRNLHFEWDQQEGVLFQYFFDEEEESEKSEAKEEKLPERHPIWSVSCPEMHAEVWEVLPLPPTDPAAEGTEGCMEEDEMRDVPASTEQTVQQRSAKEEEAPPAGPDATASGPSPVTENLMPPPALPTKKKKLPAVPVMAPLVMPSKAESSSSSSASRAPTRGGLFDDLETDLDDGIGPVMMGPCYGPSAAPSSASSSSKRQKHLPQAEMDDDDTGGCSAILDSDDEDEVAGLGKEDCALPPAPAEPAAPTAADLELDMFAGL